MTHDHDVVAQAIADLAGQTGVEPSAIELVSHEEVTWRDGSLGCPQPGRMYTQALVKGYRIVLNVESRQIVYHGATGKPPFRCDDPAPNGAFNADPGN